MPAIHIKENISPSAARLHKEARIGTLDSKRINPSARFANVIYKSDATGEINTIYVWKGMHEEDVLKQYATKFPRDCALHLKHVQELNSALNDPTGISEARIMAIIGSFPIVIQMCLEYIDPEYFYSDDPAKYKKKLYSFVRKFPKFMVGDHRKTNEKYTPRIQHPGSDAYTVTDRRQHVQGSGTEENASIGDDSQGRDRGAGTAPGQPQSKPV